MRTFRVVLALAFLTAALAACGGGGDGPGISPPAEPEATARPAAGATRTPTDTSPAVVGKLEPTGTPDPVSADTPVQSDPAPAPTAAPAPSNTDPQLVGSWRFYSESLYYDAGGGGVMDSSEVVGTDLVLYEDGSWEFGSSSGWWSVAAIDGSEWDRWLVSPYGPTRKILLQGWNGGTGDGPLDEETGYVDFVWVIYHVDSPDPGTVYIKFGH
jgi:predicted small lipoprotein YifL